MNCRIEEVNTFGRKLYIDIPAADFNERIQRELRKLSTTAGVKGFRPGKVPVEIIQRYYGASVERDVAGGMLRESYNEILKQNSFFSLITPVFDDLQIDKEKGVGCTVYIEVLPDLQVKLENITIEKPICEISEADIDLSVERVHRNHVKWQPQTRAVRMGDKVVVDFSVLVKGEPPGAPYTDKVIVLGEHSLGENLDRQLENMRIGEEKEIEIDPSAFKNKTYSKEMPMRCRVHIKSIEEPILPESDDDFLENIGIKEGGLDALRSLLRKDMEVEVRRQLTWLRRKNVKKALSDYTDIEVPPGMVKENIAELKKKISQFSSKNLDTEQLPDDTFEEEAIRRSRTNILFRYLIEEYDIKSDRRSCETLIDEIALAHENPDQVKDFYHSNLESYEMIELMVIEDKIVDLLTEKASMIEKKYAYFDIIDSKAEYDYA